MKGTITQYVTLGVMLLLMILIVSLYPEHGKSTAGIKFTNHPHTKVSKLGIHSHGKVLRAD